MCWCLKWRRGEKWRKRSVKCVSPSVVSSSSYAMEPTKAPLSMKFSRQERGGGGWILKITESRCEPNFTVCTGDVATCTLQGITEPVGPGWGGCEFPWLDHWGAGTPLQKHAYTLLPVQVLPQPPNHLHTKYNIFLWEIIKEFLTNFKELPQIVQG